MASTAHWLNTAWMLSGAREAYAFRRAVGDVRSTQERILFRTLRDNRDTWYGRRFRFDQINSVRDFQQRVPVVGYEPLRDSINRIAEGESGVLTRDPVRLLEPTGGSSQAVKLIPYTNALRKEFQRAIAAWVFDLMHRLPAVRHGRAYWSISPMAEERRVSPGGIAIGFEDDRDYLNTWQRWAVSRLMVLPCQVRQLQSIDNARYVTLLQLLASEDLSLISVWSPTYLASLISEIPKWLDWIADDLRQGQIRLPDPLGESRQVSIPFRANARRADQVQATLSLNTDLQSAVSQCWPKLAVVSCWGDASSSLYLPSMRTLFPQAFIQPKGLLATEGVVSIPLLSAPGSVLAIRSHFLEFAEVAKLGDTKAKIHLADQLESGGRYRVILTTGGGLYRYDLGDEVEVIGFYDRCPCIRLIGRGDLVSDLVGEKLHEQFVRGVIEESATESRLDVRFAMVVPVAGQSRRYRLYLELNKTGNSVAGLGLEERIEARLRDNPHYRIAVDSGQLQPLELKLLRGRGWKNYVDTCIKRGQKLGDIKPVALDPWTGWADVFADSVAESRVNSRAQL